MINFKLRVKAIPNCFVSLWADLYSAATAAYYVNRAGYPKSVIFSLLMIVIRNKKNNMSVRLWTALIRRTLQK